MDDTAPVPLDSALRTLCDAVIQAVAHLAFRTGIAALAVNRFLAFRADDFLGWGDTRILVFHQVARAVLVAIVIIFDTLDAGIGTLAIKIVYAAFGEAFIDWYAVSGITLLIVICPANGSIGTTADADIVIIVTVIGSIAAVDT